MFEDFLSKFEVVDVFFLGFLALCVHTLYVYLLEYFFERKIDKRLEVLERIILDKSTVTIPVSSDNIECYFKFIPEDTAIKVSDLDIDCSAVDIDKPTE